MHCGWATHTQYVLVMCTVKLCAHELQHICHISVLHVCTFFKCVDPGESPTLLIQADGLRGTSRKASTPKTASEGSFFLLLLSSLKNTCRRVQGSLCARHWVRVGRWEPQAMRHCLALWVWWGPLRCPFAFYSLNPWPGPSPSLTSSRLFSHKCTLEQIGCSLTHQSKN